MSISARVGSIADNSLGGWYSYRASKTALNQLTKCMSVEFARRKQHIATLLLHPGTVDTDLSKPFQKVEYFVKLCKPLVLLAHLCPCLHVHFECHSEGVWGSAGCVKPLRLI